MDICFLNFSIHRTNQLTCLFFLFKALTDQQRELFQTMDQQQKVQFIQRLKLEKEMKMRQEQMQIQAAGGAPGAGPPQPFPQQQVSRNQFHEFY